MLSFADSLNISENWRHILLILVLHTKAWFTLVSFINELSSWILDLFRFSTKANFLFSGSFGLFLMARFDLLFSIAEVYCNCKVVLISA